MTQSATTRVRERWLLDLTDIPTAAGHERRVLAWIRAWVARRKNLRVTEDRAGNLVITQRRRSRPGGPAPLFITAHVDHPAFVVSTVSGRDLELEFRGGVHDPYFAGARLEIFSGRRRHTARTTSLDPKATPFKRVTARLDSPGARVSVGDIGRFLFRRGAQTPRLLGDRLYTYACDDLAAVVAALSAIDLLRMRDGMSHVGLLFTRAEEVGFIGALAACRARSIPQRARLLCLENSRSFPESPIGGGPIVRVGDKLSVFEPTLTNDITMLMTEHEKAHPGFRWQRKLMPGGTCEATAFSAFGYRSTCLCLPLGNYHNMTEIDAVLAGRRPARVGPEFISLSDFHGLIDMLVVCAEGLDAPGRPSLRTRMDDLLRKHGGVLKTEDRRQKTEDRS